MSFWYIIGTDIRNWNQKTNWKSVQRNKSYDHFSRRCRTKLRSRSRPCGISFISCRRLPKLQIFINHNVFLEHNRDRYKDLQSKDKLKIRRVEQKLWALFRRYGTKLRYRSWLRGFPMSKKIRVRGKIRVVGLPETCTFFLGLIEACT